MAPDGGLDTSGWTDTTRIVEYGGAGWYMRVTTTGAGDISTTFIGMSYHSSWDWVDPPPPKPIPKNWRWYHAHCAAPPERVPPVVAAARALRVHRHREPLPIGQRLAERRKAYRRQIWRSL